MAKIYLQNEKVMEFIDELATQITIQRFGEDTYAPSSEVGQEHVMMLQEDAQDFYNEQYDWVETMLNTTLGVYSNRDLENPTLEEEKEEKPNFKTMYYYFNKLKNIKL